jgi:hypothetical protein
MSDEMKTCGHCHFKCPSGAIICGHCHAEFRSVEVETTFEDRIGMAIGYGIAGLVIWFLICLATHSLWNWSLGRFEIMWWIFGIGGAVEGITTKTKTVEMTFR